MFTGIVEERGSVVGTGSRLEVRCRTVAADSSPGSSVAVNGVCLTVVERTPGETTEDAGAVLAFELSAETLARTALGRVRPGDSVNLERPVTLLTRLGGHLVQGHVDGVGRIEALEPSPPGMVMTVSLPDGLLPYVVEKGSVAVDGVSLTVTDTGDGAFGVALVPHTLQVTTLGTARPGDPVNVEVDVIAKYVERFAAAKETP